MKLNSLTTSLFLTVMALSSCQEQSEILNQESLVISATQPNHTLVKDQTTAIMPPRPRGILTIDQGSESSYMGIIVTDTILYSRVELDDSFIGEVSIDLSLNEGEYLERQQTERMVRVERGRIEDLVLRDDFGSSEHPPFTPASNYRVIIKSNDQICVQAIPGGEDQTCFRNLNRRLLVTNQEGIILVYDLELSLSR